MKSGDINFIGATSTNNGLTAKISNSEHLHPAGTITVTYNGSVGEAFYQTEPFWASDDVNVLYPKIHFNERIALYILAPLIKKGKSYGYSYKWTKERMEADEIYLPVTSNKNIDFVFIEELVHELEEERVHELEEERVHELEAYLKEAGFEDCVLTQSESDALKNVERLSLAQPYILGNLFEGSTGDVDLQKKDINGKGVYFVNSGVQNCGIKGKTDRTAKKFKANTITIDFFGNAYYRPFEYKMATHNHVFSLSGEAIRDENIGLYLTTTMLYMRQIFSYNNMGTWSVIKDMSIYLPTTPLGDIDYAFMSNYITAIKKQCIARLKQEIAKERSAYEQVLTGQAKQEVEQMIIAER